MTEFENLAAATAALEAAAQKDADNNTQHFGNFEQSHEDTSVAPATQNNAPSTENTQTDDPLALLGIDLSSLPADKQKEIRDGFLRRDDYTRKTQETAELRKQYENLGDPSEVQKAVEFFRNYDSNPVFALQTANRARQVIGDMVATGQLRKEDIGSLADTLELGSPADVVDDNVIVDYNQLPKEVRDKLAKIDQLESRFDTKDQRDLQSQFEERIGKDLAELKVEHPEWDFDAEDKEGAALFAIASSDPTLGLKGAAKLFENATNHRVEAEREAYLKAKMAHAALPTSPDGAAGGSVTPTTYNGIRDPKLFKAALARLTAETGS